MPTLKRRTDYYDKEVNRAVLFFSASSTGDTEQLLEFGIREILVSYFYMRKSLPYYDGVLDKLHKEKGLFMTDSGAFSFMASGVIKDEMYTEKYWLPYLEEYVDWLWKHKDKIFVAANLDLDKIVGREVVDKWNRKYFEPLEKAGLQIVYVAHENDTDDKHAIKHFGQYCKRYKYVGINQSQKEYASHFYQMAKHHNVRVHGFAWTEMNIVKHYPFFSLDSTTWLGGVRYGTTYDYDGKNFRTIDYKHKYIRKSRRLKYRKIGVSLDDVLGEEKRKPINRMNLLGWVGFRKEFLRMANLKLHNRTVAHYTRKP